MKRRSLKFSICSVLLMAVVMIGLFPKVIHAGVLGKYTNAKIYDVTSYGADSTGRVSSDASVQKALLAAKTDLRKGNMEGKEKAIIYFPSGSYKVTSPMRLYTGMGIAAETKAKVQCGDNDGIQVYTTQDCSIEGGTWTASGKGSLIHATRAQNLTVKNMTLKGGKIGIAAYEATMKISNVSVSKSTHEGFCFTNSSKIEVADSKVFLNGSGYPKKGYLGHGIGVYNGATLKITNTQIYSNKTGGISLQKGKLNADKLSIHDNGYVGVGTSKVCSVVMKNSDIYHNGYKISGNDNGVSIVDGSSGKFTSCKFRNNEITGLLVNNGSSVYVKKCYFKGNGSHNIYIVNLGTGKSSCTVDGCTFYKCKRGSVEVYVKKKSAYSLKIKGTNKYYVKPNYIYWVNGKIYQQK